MAFINNHVLALPRTSRGNEIAYAWATGRGETQRLDFFERATYNMG